MADAAPESVIRANTAQAASAGDAFVSALKGGNLTAGQELRAAISPTVAGALAQYGKLSESYTGPRDMGVAMDNSMATWATGFFRGGSADPMTLDAITILAIRLRARSEAPVPTAPADPQSQAEKDRLADAERQYRAGIDTELAHATFRERIEKLYSLVLDNRFADIFASAYLKWIALAAIVAALAVTVLFAVGPFVIMAYFSR